MKGFFHTLLFFSFRHIVKNLKTCYNEKVVKMGEPKKRNPGTLYICQKCHKDLDEAAKELGISERYSESFYHTRWGYHRCNICMTETLCTECDHFVLIAIEN